MRLCPLRYPSATSLTPLLLPLPLLRVGPGSVSRSRWKVAPTVDGPVSETTTRDLRWYRGDRRDTGIHFTSGGRGV